MGLAPLLKLTKTIINEGLGRTKNEDKIIFPQPTNAGKHAILNPKLEVLIFRYT